MPLETTPITEIPVNANGTFDQPTWGESGPAFSVPPTEGAGLGSVALTSNTVNYEFQHPARHLRGMLDRQVLSDEGLFTSCVLTQGAWNVGAATLNITLARTRLVIDFAQDGGIVFELRAAAGTPEVLPALSDSYVDIDDAGIVTVVSVAQPGGEPAVTANSVRAYKLVTDATELTSATNVPSMPVLPCFGNVGASSFVANLITAITKLTSNTELEANGIANLFGLTNIGEDQSDTLTVESTTVTNAGWTNNGIHQHTAQLRLAVAGLLQTTTAPTAAGEFSRTSSNELLYHNGDRVAAPSISVLEQDAGPNGPAATITYLTTVNRVAAPVRLNVIFSGYLSRAGGGVIDVQLQQDNGVDGGGQLWSALGAAFSVNVPASPELVSFARVQITDATKRLYRVVVAGLGADVDDEESRLQIVPG